MKIAAMQPVKIEMPKSPIDRHSPYFRELVQMMLCHAWSIGLLEVDLWADIPNIARAAELHDIGKAALPESITRNKEKLTPEEFEIMKSHPILGAAAVGQAIPDSQRTALSGYAWEICRLHHERVDGNGYPDRLCGDEIPSYVQIISLADVYDTLRTSREHRKAFSDEQALDLIEDDACGLFDSILLDAFAPLLEPFWDLAHILAEVPNRPE